MPKLEFNADRHEYSIDGVIIPGYSQIAKDLGLSTDYSKVDRAVMAHKRSIGKAVHTAILWDSTDELDMLSLEVNDVLPRFKSWLRFKELYKPKILTQYSEQPICSFRWRYGVTPDIIAEIQGVLTIIEIKNVAQMSEATALQTEAQRIAAEETYKIKIKQRWGLQLIPGALPKLAPYTSLTDQAIWLSAVNVWNYKERLGLWQH